MSNTNSRLILTLFLLSISILSINSQTKSGIVQAHGRLQVKGGKMVDQNSKPVFLKGMSLFWSQWYGNFWNPSAIAWLVSDFKIQIVRAAMAVNRGGYVENPAVEKAKMVTVINAAVANDIYVIIDWHAENEDPNIGAAKTFFGEISREFGHLPNVLFETFNEPGPNSWGQTKQYHQEIVNLIRQNSQNVCILGTATWSQDVDIAANDQVNGTNQAYTLHFYAATHKQELRDKADRALQRGIAIFITEWGTSEASGNGRQDLGEATVWQNWAKERSIGNTNWAVYDKDEICAILRPGSNPNGGWSSGDLTSSGNFVRAYFRGENPGPNPPTPPTPPGPTNGCCSWDGGNSCGPTTDYCKANKANCENNCQGKWISKSSGCCSWSSDNSCGPTTAYCKASKGNCENACQGHWVG